VLPGKRLRLLGDSLRALPVSVLLPGAQLRVLGEGLHLLGAKLLLLRSTISFRRDSDLRFRKTARVHTE
jgi:hypothetical protein